MSETQRDLLQRVSVMVLRELTEGGKRDLTAMRLDDLENEVFGMADRISKCVAEALLQEQAVGLSKQAPSCPCCQGELEPKASRARTLQLRRGEADWDEPVWRCAACRRDFFPPVGGDGVCGGGGV